MAVLPSSNVVMQKKQRKAYTITKQRERWTEAEHEKFLQALKRWGRAWRKIEGTVSTRERGGGVANEGIKSVSVVYW